jgi:predicted P-loop ATPase
MADTLNYLKKYLQSEYEFRKNTVTGRLEYRFAGTNHKFERLDSYKLNSILWALKSDEHSVTKADLSTLLNSEFTPRVDVFEAYFKDLSPLTENKDYIDLLSATITTNNQQLWRHCFKKWLVATVACAINPRKSNHQVLVLVGPQGIGKTTWLNKLLPPGLDGYLYAGYINPNNKDTLSTLSENLFINLDELGSFRNGDLESLKELITKDSIKVRRPYAEFADNFIRRASFMGAVNNFSFLSDATGNRRFLPFSVSSVDYMHTIDMDKVYKQAYDHYVNKTIDYWFDMDEIAAMSEHMEQYEDKSIEQQLIEKYFTPCTEETATHALTATDIGRYLVADGLRLTNASVQRIGSIVRMLGFKRVKHKNRYQYLVELNGTTNSKNV